MFNHAIAKLIAESTVFWQIRLHPRNEFSKKDIEYHLESLGVYKFKYNIHDSVEIPLPEILSKTFMHITAFSGCLIEAKMSGVPSIIINNIGREMYKDYIDNDLVYYLNAKSDNFHDDFFKLYNNLKNNIPSSVENPIKNPILI